MLALEPGEFKTVERDSDGIVWLIADKHTEIARRDFEWVRISIRIGTFMIDHHFIVKPEECRKVFEEISKRI